MYSCNLVLFGEIQGQMGKKIQILEEKMKKMIKDYLDFFVRRGRRAQKVPTPFDQKVGEFPRNKIIACI
jgi:hypothetical protein